MKLDNNRETKNAVVVFPPENRVSWVIWGSISSLLVTSTLTKMASSSSKTLKDLWKQPAAKRLKQVSSTENFISSALASSSSRKDCDEDPKDVVSSTPEQNSRMEFNRSLAKSKRNLKLCSDKISKLNANGLLNNAPFTFMAKLFFVP